MLACRVQVPAVSARLANVGALTEEDMAARGLQLHMQDFVDAAKKVQPSATREGFGVVPNVTWDDVGALEEVCVPGCRRACM